MCPPAPLKPHWKSSCSWSLFSMHSTSEQVFYFFQTMWSQCLSNHDQQLIVTAITDRALYNCYHLFGSLPHCGRTGLSIIPRTISSALSQVSYPSTNIGSLSSHRSHYQCWKWHHRDIMYIRIYRSIHWTQQNCQLHFDQLSSWLDIKDVVMGAILVQLLTMTCLK